MVTPLTGERSQGEVGLGAKVGTSPQMVRIPSTAQYSEHRVYEDVFEPGRVYVDATQPALRLTGLADRGGLENGLEAGDGQRRCRPVAMQISARERDLAGIQAMMPTRRVVPMSWNSGPFFAWIRSSAGVTVLDRGMTSRSSRHVAEIYGRQPVGVELARAVAAAEVVHWGRLCGMTVKAQAAAAVVAELRNTVRVGRRAAWSATLGDALRASLEEMLKRDRLRVLVASGPVPLRAFDEVREWVLAEWSHRIAGERSLAQPAAAIDALADRNPVDLSIEWRDGDRIPMRAVRTLGYESLAADSMHTLSWGLRGAATRRAVARA